MYLKIYFINQVTVYQCLQDGKIKLLQAFADADSDESFYTCAWTYEPTSGHPILVAAGHRGIIRVFSIVAGDCIKVHCNCNNIEMPCRKKNETY